MAIGSLTGCPGVGGTVCVRRTVAVRAAASWSTAAATRGVPA